MPTLLRDVGMAPSTRLIDCGLPTHRSRTCHPADLIRNRLPTLPRRSIMIGDAGFTGYELWRDIRGQGHDFVMRVGANVRLLEDLAPRATDCG